MKQTPNNKIAPSPNRLYLRIQAHGRARRCLGFTLIELLVVIAIPGAINLACYDGHVETVKLDNLWSFYWHKNWEVPIKQPR